MSDKLQDSPLGRDVDYSEHYDASLLFALPRRDQRQRLGLGSELPFHGWDLWTAWELSWLDALGKPRIAVARIAVPCDSPCIVESKSLKLYFNSLYQTTFVSPAAVRQCIATDLGQCVGADVQVELLSPSDWFRNPLQEPVGQCVDELEVACEHYQPAPELLKTLSDQTVQRSWHSHLLRSRCPVTGQPDWGSLQIDWQGPDLDPASLLRYIVSFRRHQDFHEQCVERIFMDLNLRFSPEALTVQARYLRRGGIDINPVRSLQPIPPTDLRWFRQ